MYVYLLSDCSCISAIFIFHNLRKHVSKIILKILHSRLAGKAETFLSPSQFGFRENCGTRDATGVMRQIIERRLEIGKDVCVCFCGLRKGV